MKMNYDLVERESGIWIVDGTGVVAGPFDVFDNAQKWINAENNKQTFTIVNEADSNDNFTIKAETIEEAAQLALNELGWRITIRTTN